MSASTEDAVIGRLFLTTITPEQIGMALAAADELAERHTRTHRAAELAVQRAAPRPGARPPRSQRTLVHTLEPATQDSYRQKVAGWFRLKPTPPVTTPATSV